MRVFEEVEHLRRHGVRTTVATYPFGRDLPGVTIRRAPRLLGQWQVNPGSSVQKFSLDAALTVSALATARAQRPSIIHGHLHEGALIGWPIARLLHVPLVFDFQGSLTSEMVDHGFIASRGPAFAFFRAIERWVVAHADAIVTSTHRGARVLAEEFDCQSGKVCVVADAVDTRRFRPLWECEEADHRQERAHRLRESLHIPRDRPVVVYLGLLAEYQGITHLLRAAQALLDRGTEAHFLIMGYPGEERYRRLARRLGLEQHTTFPGAIRYEDAPDYLALGDVAVAPKLSETEGNGKLLNYLAMGIPTVAFDSEVSREILGDLGVFAPPGDWTALSIELEGVLREPERTQHLKRALRQRAIERHDWDQSIGRLLDVYRTALVSSKFRAQSSE